MVKFRLLLNEAAKWQKSAVDSKAVGYAPMKGGEADAGEIGANRLFPCICLLYGLHISHESVLTARTQPERSVKI